MRKILVVDDNPLILTMLTDALSAEYRVVTAPSGEAAVEILEGLDAGQSSPRETFDLIVTDLNMPGISGFELASFVKTLNHTHRFTPVILLTSAEVTKEEARRFGCAACLPKSDMPRVIAMTRILLPTAG